MIDWKRGTGKKTAAVSPPSRVLMLVLPFWPPDEKFLSLASRSVCDSYNNGGNIAQGIAGIKAWKKIKGMCILTASGRTQ